LALGRKELDLIADDFHRTYRKKSREQTQMVCDDRGVGEEPVKRHDRRSGRKQGQQGVECDAGCHQHDTIALKAFEHTPGNVHPAFGRDFRRSFG
jgi:hypothetical protein